MKCKMAIRSEFVLADDPTSPRLWRHRGREAGPFGQKWGLYLCFDSCETHQQELD